MRMPNSREISDEQEEIYMNAPMDGAVMVAGPPGTGKTVIAFLRAQALNKRNKSATVMMYGKVLRKYTSNISDLTGEDVPTDTVLSWMYGWWKRHGISTPSIVGEKVYLNVPYEKKDEVKAHGAKWDNFKRKWWVTNEDYNKNKHLFAQWPLEDHAPPKIDDYQYDWQQMFEKLAVHVANKKPVHNVGHLIIDEAQDFPPAMFKMLRFALMQMPNSGITILADENQRLNEEHNATIQQINEALAIPTDRQFLLTENFRNTREIAQLAAHFYVGLATGMPNPPSRRGERPSLVATRTLDEQVQYIVDSVTNRAFGEVGVFAHSDAMRHQLFNKLQHRLRGAYRVQTYSSNGKYKEEHPVEDLIFDKKGTLTVINRQSCKGLEFDAVFVPEIQVIAIDGSNLDTLKMNMYVMCSRARLALYLLYSTSTGEDPDMLRYFPSKASGVLEYCNG
jgi:DNA helicase-2/ATP-dependent DNA helicase PcrA